MEFLILACIFLGWKIANAVLDKIPALRGQVPHAENNRHAERMKRMDQAHEKWMARAREREALVARGQGFIGRAIQDRVARWVAGSSDRVTRVADDTKAKETAEAAAGRTAGDWATWWRRTKREAAVLWRYWARRSQERLDERFGGGEPTAVTVENNPTGEDGRDAPAGPVPATAERIYPEPPPPAAPKAIPAAQALQPPVEVVLTPEALPAAPQPIPGALPERFVWTPPPAPQVVEPADRPPLRAAPPWALPPSTPPTAPAEPFIEGEVVDTDPAPVQSPQLTTGEGNLIDFAERSAALNARKGSPMTTSQQSIEMASGETVDPELGLNFVTSLRMIGGEAFNRLSQSINNLASVGVDEGQVGEMREIMGFYGSANAKLDVMIKNFNEHINARDQRRASGAGYKENYLR